MQSIEWCTYRKTVIIMKLSGLIGSYSGIELWQHPAVSRGARFAGTTCCIYFSAVEQVHCIGLHVGAKHRAGSTRKKSIKIIK